MMPMVPINSVVTDVKQLGDVPIRSDGTRTVFVRDIGTVADSADIQTGYALVNGRRTVYIPVTKRADASTLTVVNLVKENLPKFQAVLPPGVKVSYEFDQSPYVTRAIRGLERGRAARRGADRADGAAVPARLAQRAGRRAEHPAGDPGGAAGAVGHRADGQPDDARRAGAGGRHPGGRGDRHHREHPHPPGRRPVAQAAPRCDATTETTLPRLLAMLCILAVFIPAFFMQGAARNLFVPLALAVGFSMVASYLLSSTLVPVLSIWLLRHGARRTASRQAIALRPLPRRATAGFSAGVVAHAVGRRAGLPARRGPGDLLRRPVAGPGDFPDRGCRPVRAAAARPGRHAASSRPRRSPARRWTSSAARSGQDNVADQPRLRRRAGRGVPGQHRSTSGPAARKRRCCRCSSSRGKVRIAELKERLRQKLPRGIAGRAVQLRAERHRQPGDELRRRRRRSRWR